MENNHQQSEITLLLENSMQQKLESSSCASSDKCCIYKVPEFIQKGNEKHYKPSVISIGPVNYKDKALETMQSLKWIYLKHFLQHSQNVNRNRSLKDYIDYVKNCDGKIRGQYQEQISIPDDFVEMIVLDAAFLVYLFLNNWCSNKWPTPINQTGLMPYINRDLYLLENQLPFFVLQGFFDLATGNICIPFIHITLAYIHNHTNFPGNKAIHDCMRRNNIDASSINHLLDLLRTCCCLPSNLPPRNQLDFPKEDDDTFPDTAKRLFDAGVKFEVQDSSTSPLNITFEKGKLKIPKLVLDDFTEPYLRSILFFEQYHYSQNSYIIDYIFFLDELIDTVEDVQVLDRSEIIKNDLGSDEDAIRFINKITINVNLTCKFYYSGISKDLKKYASTHWNRWLAILRRNYFSHPWAVISVIAAIVLFILTLLQTIASYITKK